MILKPTNREEWLKLRQIQGIGGSEAGCVLGVNKYKSNVQLWEEKTGRCIPEDISDKPAVRFGKFAEGPLRELFKQDYPQYKVDYHEFYMYCNEVCPFIFATLDGELTDEKGRRGILEIKTTTIQNPNQWDDWETADHEPKLPESYYTQLLHQLAATGWDFAVLKVYIRYYRDGVLRAAIRHYFIEREEVKDDIAFLISEEQRFMECVRQDKRPPQILPEI